MKKLFSICIPTYNRAKELKKCLNSFIEDAAVLNIPIYIANNHSTDETTILLKQYQMKYPHIITIQTAPVTTNVDINMWKALSMSETNYALWLGDDDTLKPKALYTIIKSLQSMPDLCVLSIKQHPLQQEYQQLDKFFADFGMIGLNCSMHFSSLIVHVPSIKKVKNPLRYDGTLHLYAGVILDYLANHIKNAKPISIITLPNLLDLATGEKRWAAKKGWIYLDFIPKWISLLPDFYKKNPLTKKQIEKYYEMISNPLSFFKFLNLRETTFKNYPLNKILSRGPFYHIGRKEGKIFKLLGYWSYYKVRYALYKLISNLSWGKLKYKCKKKIEKYRI